MLRACPERSRRVEGARPKQNGLLIQKISRPKCEGVPVLRHPVGQHGQRLVLPRRIVRRQVDSKIVLAAHVAVHHELQGEGGRFAGIEDHRTDGRIRRSTSLHHFHVRHVGEAQLTVAAQLDR